jgi:hypothetical protein
MFSSYSYLGLIGHPRIATAVRSRRALRHVHGRRPPADRHAGAAPRARARAGRVPRPGGRRHVRVRLRCEHRRDHVAVRPRRRGDPRPVRAPVDPRRRAHGRLREPPLPPQRHGGPRAQTSPGQNRGAQRILVAVDSVFSMDGDQAPIADLIELKRSTARSCSSMRPTRSAPSADRPRHLRGAGHRPGDIDILTGSLSKGIPSSGGFVAGSRGAQDLHPARLRAVHVLRGHDAGQRGGLARGAAHRAGGAAAHGAAARATRALLKDGLTRSSGFDTGASTTPVLPLLLGDEWRAYRVAREMLERGIFVSAVVYPAVSPGQARLRLCATAAHRRSTSSGCSARSPMEVAKPCKAAEEAAS